MSAHQLMIVVHGEPSDLVELQREVFAQVAMLGDMQVKKLEVKPLHEG